MSHVFLVLCFCLGKKMLNDYVKFILCYNFAVVMGGGGQEEAGAIVSKEVEEFTK